MPVRRRRRRAAGPAGRADRRRLARLRRRASGPGSATASGCTGPWDPGARPPLQPGQAAARPLRPRARRRAAASTPPCSATAVGERRHRARPARLGAVRAALGGRRPGATTGRATGRPDVPWADTVVYELHVKGFTARAPGRARGAARHVRRARAPGRDRAPPSARRHGGRAAAGAPLHAASRRCCGAGPDQLLGLQHARASSRRTPATRPRASRGEQVARVPRHGAGAARGRASR